MQRRKFRWTEFHKSATLGQRISSTKFKKIAMRFIRPSKDKINNLDKAFREGLRNHNATPDPEMWDKIDSELNADIQRNKYNHWYRAALFLLIPITMINIFINYDFETYYSDLMFENEYQSTTPNHSLALINYNSSVFTTFNNAPIQFNNFSSGISAYDENQNTNKSSDNNFNAKNANVYGSFGKLAVQGANDDGIEKHDQTPVIESDPILLASIDSDYIPLENSNAIQPSQTANGSNVLSSDKEKFEKLSKKSRNQELNDFVKGLSLGFSAGADYNKMPRREGQFSPLLGDNVTFRTAPSFRFGGNVGWNFNRFFAIETGIYSSQMSIDYLDNRFNKIFIEGNIRAQYLEIPLLFKVKYTGFNRFNKLPHSIGLNIGMTYAHLRKATIDLSDSQIENASTYFDPFQLGLNAGIEYNWFVHRNVSVFANVSAAVFSSKDDFPQFSKSNSDSDLRYNYNFQLGLNFLIPTSR